LLTPSEKRFIRSWEEQRTGGRWPYYISYTLVNGFIVTILTYIVLLWILQQKIRPPYWLIPTIGFFTGCVISIFSWTYSERKFKKIIRREIRHGSPAE
jgi:hypothetical protein